MLLSRLSTLEIVFPENHSVRFDNSICPCTFGGNLLRGNDLFRRCGVGRDGFSLRHFVEHLVVVMCVCLQHYMLDSTSNEQLVSVANVKDGDLVLEIGPGTGSLTNVLINAGATVLAIEKVGLLL